MRVFIGSSNEQRRLVEWLTGFIRKNYHPDIIPVPWTQRWEAGHSTLDNLMDLVEKTDAAILFWTADDKTWYRGAKRDEPRDNVVFEAGLFLAAHGLVRSQIFIPQYAKGDRRTRVAVPSDVLGLTVNNYHWPKDNEDIETTELPSVARAVCEGFMKLGLRPRRPASLQKLKHEEKVEDIRSFVGPLRSLSSAMDNLEEHQTNHSIDVLGNYRIGFLTSLIQSLREDQDARLRVCLANVFDEQLLSAYLRKYKSHRDRPEEIRIALEKSIREMLGPCRVEVGIAPDFRVSVMDIETRPKARCELRLTRQVVTFGYYRVDNLACIMPQNMKEEKGPDPWGWLIDKDTAPKTFKQYEDEYEKILKEADIVFSAHPR